MPSSTRPVEDSQLPPQKRVKFAPLHDDVSRATEIQPHPLRIKPSGNALGATTNLRDTSTGLFCIFPDELILQVFGYLGSEDLVSLGKTSKGMYGFSRAEELWKQLFIESELSKNPFTWQGTWRLTYLNRPAKYDSQIPLPNFYSDCLYRPWHMSQITPGPYASHIPVANRIQRFDNLDPSEFPSYSSIPFILTDPVKSWPAYKWTYQTLCSQFGSTPFRAEAVDWPLSTYIFYMLNQVDESPLYLFDRNFVQKTNSESAFQPPECFGPDYFAVLGEQRPDHRWMILGPSRSGSTFHKDPNATSAWNAVLQGEKYWIMFPPTVTPPGVFVSDDQAEVTSPLSIAEWLVSFHSIARKTPGCVEGICKAGEILYVPSGWWHLVVNTEDSLALTQNFVPEDKVSNVLEFLDEQRGSVSGFDCDKVMDPYGLFVERMGEQYPEVLEQAQEQLRERREKRERKTKWEQLVEAKQTGGGGFSFGFGGGDSDSD